MSADLYFTKDSYFFFLFFIHPLISDIAERNSTISGHMVGRKCDLKMHVQNLGYPFPYKSGAKTPFSTILQLKGRFNGLYLRNKRRHKQTGYCVATTRDLLYRLKTTCTLVHKRLQVGAKFSPTLCKFCIPLHCQGSQTEISKRNSATLCQTVDGRSR